MNLKFFKYKVESINTDFYILQSASPGEFARAACRIYGFDKFPAGAALSGYETKHKIAFEKDMRSVDADSLRLLKFHKFLRESGLPPTHEEMAILNYFADKLQAGCLLICLNYEKDLHLKESVLLYELASHTFLNTALFHTICMAEWDKMGKLMHKQYEARARRRGLIGEALVADWVGNVVSDVRKVFVHVEAMRNIQLAFSALHDEEKICSIINSPKKRSSL